MEFSKKLVIWSWSVTCTLALLTILAVFLQIDASELGVLTGLSFAETGVATGFYYWKAKSENRIKLTKQMMKDWAEEYGVDSVVSLAPLILGE